MKILQRGRRCWCFPILLFIKLLLFLAFSILKVEGESAECPPPGTLLGCTCYNYEDRLFFECAGATGDAIRSSLQAVTDITGNETVLQSLRIYELDKTVEELEENSFLSGSQFEHLEISHSSIRIVKKTAFLDSRDTLESLGLIAGHLKHIPQEALLNLHKLIALDLEGNFIQELSSGSFDGLKLTKLKLKGNQISRISDDAFGGLDDSLHHLDMSENKLKLFSLAALKNLQKLDSLSLAWNEISQLTTNEYPVFTSLLTLDLSSNNLEELREDYFQVFPFLRTLSLYYNSIGRIHRNALISLEYLESIDLSHNNIVFLDVATFKYNIRLRTIELSHNHIHSINGVFTRLPELRELYLAENNILGISDNAFAGSNSLEILDLEHNAIRRIGRHGLMNLTQLLQLNLSKNYLRKIPKEFFAQCQNLQTLSLNENNIRQLQPGIFKGLHQLDELHIQMNQIIEIKEGVFSSLNALSKLHLQENNIESIASGAFNSLKNLKHLNIQNNQLLTVSNIFQFQLRNTSVNGTVLLTIYLNDNELESLDNDFLKGQSVIWILSLNHNKLTRLQSPLFRDLRSIERLYLTDNLISIIDDTTFQPMKALKILDLSMNKLTQVTSRIFSELYELEELYLQHNNIERLDINSFETLKKLKILHLANNYIKVLRNGIFQPGLSIKILNLRNCSIALIDDDFIKNLSSLSELDLRDNSLKVSTLRHLHSSNLKILSFSGNNLSEGLEISLSGLSAIRDLFLDNTGISQILESVFLLNKNLVHLYLKNNSLSNLPPGIFRGLHSLEEVLLDHNQFTDIPYSALSNLSNLEILSLANNQIMIVDMRNFAKVNYLRKLDLSFNRINILSGFSETNFPRLLSVDLSNNRLNILPEDFFAHSNSLRRVDISKNNFIRIPAESLSVQNLPGLTWLNLTGNPLIDVHNLPIREVQSALQELYISSANLSTLTAQYFESYPDIIHLFMEDNNIHRISPVAFQNLPKLLTIQLGINKLIELPVELLQNLQHLRILNLTRNFLKEVRQFPENLKYLQILDLSYNQLTSLDENTFENLDSLVELHLSGNQINIIPSLSMEPLKKLRLLDLRRNYLEELPLNSFRALETQIRSLKIGENPLNCNCNGLQELWEWLRDHQKIIDVVSGHQYRKSTVKISRIDGEILKCEHPSELQGRIFLDLDPVAICSTPLILDLQILDIQTSSISISWLSKNHSGLYGYQIVYYIPDDIGKIQQDRIDLGTQSVRLTNLSPDTRYRICVNGLGDWIAPALEEDYHWQLNNSQDNVMENSLMPIMDNSLISCCTEVKTLGLSKHIMEGSLGNRENLSNILTRRLGLIIGSCMGFMVFILLITILSYFKIKKRKASSKREQPIAQNSREYMSYRHFSLQSGDRLENSCPTTSNNISTNPVNL